MEISNEITIERKAEFGIIMEKNYTLDIAYQHLKNKPGVTNLIKTLNPIWGEDILYFTYKDKNIVMLSAKGTPIAVNAVERIKRTGGKYIALIGTCGATNEDICDGTFALAKGAVRDENISNGYLEKKIPAIADEELNCTIKSILLSRGVVPTEGLAFTTDRRYREDPDELSTLNKKAGVIYIDMETSAVLLVSRYYEMKAIALKIVTDCATKPTSGDLKGVFDKSKNFEAFVNPKLIFSIDAVLDAYATY